MIVKPNYKYFFINKFKIVKNNIDYEYKEDREKQKRIYKELLFLYDFWDKFIILEDETCTNIINSFIYWIMDFV